MTPPDKLALQFLKLQSRIFVLFPITYRAPPFSSLAVQLSKSQSITLSLFPVMNNAPPQKPAKLSAKLDFLTVTFEPVRQIVPPLEEDLLLLVPLLFVQVMLNIIPSLPSQYTAGPSSPAILSEKVELTKLQ